MSEVIQGIDISKHQGSAIDFNQVRGAGFRFCICKCSEGADYEDPMWVSNMRSIHVLNENREDLPYFYPGAYHFARPDNRVGRTGGETEGRWFSQVLKKTAQEIGFSLDSNFIEPALDFEKYSESDFQDNIPWIEGFLHVLKQETGREGMIYTGRNVWRYEVGDTDVFAVKGVPLWQVQYSSTGSDPEAYPTRMPADPSKQFWTPTLWQWSGGGDFDYYNQEFGPIPGAGVVDVNRLYGGESALDKLALSKETIPVAEFPPPPPTLDLKDLRGSFSLFTARVQSLLLALNYGPQGLVNSSGFPDGLSGPKTEGYLLDFKKSHSLPENSIVDWQTWWCLLLCE